MMSPKRWTRQLVALAVVGAAAIGVVPPSGPGAGTVSADPGELGAGGEFHTVETVRIFDSRGDAPAVSGVPFDVKVLGEGGVPADSGEVLAAFVTVTVIGPSEHGFAEAYPKGARPNPPTSLINFEAGVDVPNLAVLGLSEDGYITIRLETIGDPNGTAHFAVDLLGWISKSAHVDDDNSGARLKAVDPPFRPFDSRETSALGPNETRMMQVRGAGVIPDSADVTGVLVNLTAVNDIAGSQNTFVSALAEDLPPGETPGTSSTNVAQGLIKANLAVVPVGADGKIRLYNSAGNMHLLVDVFGYFIANVDEATYDGRIIPLQSPFRAFDTRDVILFGNVPLGFASREDWSFRCFAADVGVPVAGGGTEPVGRQTALIGNLTGVDFDRIRPDLPNRTFMSMYPTPPAPLADPPGTSNINVFESQWSMANLSLLTYGSADPDGAGPKGVDDYMVQAYNDQGTMHYIMDVFAVVLGDGAPPDETGCSTPV